MIRSHITSLLASTALYAPADAPLGVHKTDSIEVSGNSGSAGSISMDITGGDEPKITTSTEGGEQTDHIEVGEGAVNEQKPAAEGEAEGETAEDGDKPETTEDDAPEPGDKPELPAEFKADDPEVVKAYDANFRGADGKLDMNALSAQWWANAQASEKNEGSLSEGTYAYLDSLGIPKEMVQSAEAGQQALNTIGTQKLFTRAGGKANLDAAISWGTKDAGYTEAQQDAFNAAIDKGGDTALDAIDLLMTRYEKATSRKATPNKSAAGEGHGGEGDGAPAAPHFKSKQEWLDARKEAGSNMSKQAEVSKKFRASPGAAGW